MHSPAGAVKISGDVMCWERVAELLPTYVIPVLVLNGTIITVLYAVTVVEIANGVPAVTTAFVPCVQTVGTGGIGEGESTIVASTNMRPVPRLIARGTNCPVERIGRAWSDGIEPSLLVITVWTSI